ncbi:hypothetical protein [Oryzobacter terrae]|uniref:hypothetical protein n=1 Tax=Oryzobacter terrae TaxID=1620385 RepID=UPI00366BCAE6
MGFLDRLRGRDDEGAVPSARPSAPPPDDEHGDALDDLEPVEEIGTRRLTAEEEAGLESVRARYADHGIDPADLSTIAAAWDRAVAGADADDDSATEVVDVIGTAVGDHLVTAGYRWVVSSDPFGTDLAVEPPRKGVPVVTRMLVAVRWMARESGWVTGVVEHLARSGRR